MSDLSANFAFSHFQRSVYYKYHLWPDGFVVFGHFFLFNFMIVDWLWWLLFIYGQICIGPLLKKLNNDLRCYLLTVGVCEGSENVFLFKAKLHKLINKVLFLGFGFLLFHKLIKICL